MDRKDSLCAKFVEYLPSDHIFQSRVLDGFSLDTRWFLQRPLPPTLTIVRQLLGDE